MATCCQRRDRLVYVVDLGAVWPTLAATASYWNVTRVWIGDSVRRMLFCGNGTCNWEDQSSTLNSTCPEGIATTLSAFKICRIPKQQLENLFLASIVLFTAAYVVLFSVENEVEDGFTDHSEISSDTTPALQPVFSSASKTTWSSVIASKFRSDIQRDGMHQEWHPKIVVEHESYARQTVAMIIPYRDRESHLKIFLDHIRPFLRKQNISYQIFVVEQVRNQTFNKGLLTNVGFVFADRIGSFSCFIFHDVDLLPENDRNLYQCDDQPRHFAVAIDKNGYKQPYDNYVGGVLGMTGSQYRRVNGYSNLYWGWGGEDDDIHVRIKEAGMYVLRHPSQIGRYSMIKHDRDRGNEVNPCRMHLLNSARDRLKTDGLSDLAYRLIRIDRQTLYTKLLVDAFPEVTFKKIC